eukprot:scaffold8056_cov114-Isochrysis_galbana.AAC.3
MRAYNRLSDTGGVASTLFQNSSPAAEDRERRPGRPAHAFGSPCAPGGPRIAAVQIPGRI